MVGKLHPADFGQREREREREVYRVTANKINSTWLLQSLISNLGIDKIFTSGVWERDRPGSVTIIWLL